MENENVNGNVLQPDYIQELVELIRSNESDEIIADKIDNYHDNDTQATLK